MLRPSRKTSRRIFAALSINNTWIFSALKCADVNKTGGSILNADNPPKWGNFACRFTAWIGYSANPPLSNDFVPVFPWAGLTLLGIACAKAVDIDKNPLISAGVDSPFLSKLAWLGRHSLAIYLIHQPVMLAIIVPLSRLF
ncbi:MAG: heparan-alpha-glucosaminide N-acetyltransferase domain-containing protein [Roseovarius sp.]|nr:heparan-alpha-glucosaminide N-acetyltransferase domain-containing protein [Roseovarius sp.]